MIDQQYRQDFELACKKLGEKYGDRWNKVLSQIKQNRKNAEHNRADTKLDILNRSL